MKTLLNKTGIFLLIVLQHIVFAGLLAMAITYLFDIMTALTITVFENFSWFDWSGGPRHNPLENISVEKWGILIGIIILAIGAAVIGFISYLLRPKYAPIIALVLGHIYFIALLVDSYDYLQWFQFIVFFIVMYITTWVIMGASFTSIEASEQ